MKYIVNIFIKLILLFIGVQYIFNFTLSICNNVFYHIGGLKYLNSIKFIDIIKIFIPHIATLFILIIIFIILWKNSNKIAEKIVGEQDNIEFGLNYKEILSIAIIILSLYCIIFNFPVIISAILNLINIQMQDIDKETMRQYNNSLFIENILTNLVEIIIAILLIKHRNKIIRNI